MTYQATMKVGCLLIIASIQISCYAFSDVVEHINNHIKLLYTIDLRYKSYPYENNQRNNILDSPLKDSFFKSDTIRRCINTIERAHTIIPLFSMWDEFIAYGLESSEDQSEFLHECCLLVFIIYNKSICYASAADYMVLRVDISEIRDLYVAIASLPIGRLLNILDEVAQGFTSVIAQHNKSAPEGGYFGWIHNNWWIPPTVLAGVVTAIVLGKKTKSTPQPFCRLN